MTIQAKILGAIAVSGLAAFAMTSQANALTAQECSAKYQAAKTAGTLGGQKWNDFRKAQCGADATAAPAAAARRCGPGRRAEGSRQERIQEGGQGSRGACRAVRTRGLIRARWIRNIPRKPPGKARMHTCLDQYNANKATNANGGMKWIQKGGGYYSECTKKLKGAA